MNSFCFLLERAEKITLLNKRNSHYRKQLLLHKNSQQHIQKLILTCLIQLGLQHKGQCVQHLVGDLGELFRNWPDPRKSHPWLNPHSTQCSLSWQVFYDVRRCPWQTGVLSQLAPGKPMRVCLFCLHIRMVGKFLVDCLFMLVCFRLPCQLPLYGREESAISTYSLNQPTPNHIAQSSVSAGLLPSLVCSAPLPASLPCLTLLLCLTSFCLSALMVCLPGMFFILAQLQLRHPAKPNQNLYAFRTTSLP